MILKSERLTYTRWAMGDFEQLSSILGNPNVCKYLPGKDNKTDDEIKKWLQYYVNSFNDSKGNKIFKVITDQDEVIGYCGLGYVKEFDAIEIMYGLKEEFWGNGFGTEISLRMKELAIQLNLNFLIALADIDNVGSNRILLTSGFDFVKKIDLWGAHLNYYEMTI